VDGHNVAFLRPNFFFSCFLLKVFSIYFYSISISIYLFGIPISDRVCTTLRPLFLHIGHHKMSILFVAGQKGAGQLEGSWHLVYLATAADKTLANIEN